MTSSKQPHPQRCETCKNVDCDLHEQGKGNRNPETGYEWDHYHWYHKIIDEVGCASHGSATEPGGIDARAELHKMAVGIHCPSCDWKQIVPLDDWLFQSQYGHGYTCGSGKCPSHTHLVQDDSDDRDTAIAQAAREEVLDALEQKILSKMLPKSHQWEPGMYIQYDDVLSMMESLRSGGK